MADVVLFHHVMGRTDGMVALGEQLERAGRRVHVPDLFEGQHFESIEEGVAHVDSIGIPVVLERASAFVQDLPANLVFAGVSLGVLPAQSLAQNRTGAVGVVLLEGCVPPSAFGDEWPAGLPVQIHGMSDDPFFAGEGDLETARALVEAIDDEEVGSLFVYPGDHHLFIDSSLATFDPDAAGQALARILAFLSQLETRS